MSNRTTLPERLNHSTRRNAWIGAASAALLALPAVHRAAAVGSGPPAGLAARAAAGGTRWPVRHRVRRRMPSARAWEQAMSARRGGPPILLTRTDHQRLWTLTSLAFEHLPYVSAFLAAELERARLVDPGEVPPTVVTMNSRVAFRESRSDAPRSVRLTYPAHANPELGLVSVLTMTGAALIGLEENQVIEWRSRCGTLRSLEVTKVQHQPEATGLYDL